MYKRYFEERHLIPKGNLVEIKYEDFIQYPLENVEKIYTTLGLEDFIDSKKIFSNYASSQKYFKTSHYEVDSRIKDKISKKWNCVIKEYGYDI